MNLPGRTLDDVLAEQEGVLATSQALRFMSYGQLRWRVTSGRWQKPVPGVVVAQSGPLTDSQRLRAILLRAGPHAVLAGLTAARLDGLKGFGDRHPRHETPVYLLVSSGWRPREQLKGLSVITHHSRALTDLDVHQARHPRRTRIARSLVDAAVWMPASRGAMAVLAAGVQQGLVRPDDLRSVASRVDLRDRHKLIAKAIADIDGGSQALSELDFLRLVVRPFQLPEPTRQAARRDARGRRRWIDAMWDEYKVVIEIDGSQHVADPVQRWDDMQRDTDLALEGYITLRFPAWLIRSDPGYVASRTLQALRKAGYQG